MLNDDGESNKQQIDSDFADDNGEGPFLRENVYFAAKEGQSLVLYTLLSRITNEKTRKSIINTVSHLPPVNICYMNNLQNYFKMNQIQLWCCVL